MIVCLVIIIGNDANLLQLILHYHVVMVGIFGRILSFEGIPNADALPINALILFASAREFPSILDVEIFHYLCNNYLYFYYFIFIIDIVIIIIIISSTLHLYYICMLV